MLKIEQDASVLPMLNKSIIEHSRKRAIIFLGTEFTYGELGGLIKRFASGLTGIGVKPGTKVLLYLPNSPQWVIAFFGVMSIGGVPVPVSPIYTPQEILYMSNDCGAETIICQDTNFGYVKEIMPKCALERIIYTNIVDMLPKWKKVAGFLFDQVPHGVVKRDSQVYRFMALLKNAGHPPEADGLEGEALSFILYTGGTTGFPKGVPWSHAGLLYGNLEWMELLKAADIAQTGSKLLLQLPLFHILGMDVLIGFGLLNGNTCILIPQPQVDAILECVQREKTDLFFGVPTLYRMILENDRLDQYDLSCLKYCWSGGDVLPSEVFNRWDKKIGIPIHQIYGATEVNTMMTSDMGKKPQHNNVGPPITVASKKFMLIDPETEDPITGSGPGELLVTAPWLLKKYLNKPEETALSFLEVGGEVYYRTRDVLRFENGELYFVDRSADVIKHKGYRVSASEVEAVLQDHPGVIGACVVGVPDKKVGERIKAFVVLKEGVKGVAAHDLIKQCRERLASYKVPQYIEFRDMLPKSKVGKMLRREMRDEERQKVG